MQKKNTYINGTRTRRQPTLQHPWQVKKNHAVTITNMGIRRQLSIHHYKHCKSEKQKLQIKPKTWWLTSWASISSNKDKQHTNNDYNKNRAVKKSLDNFLKSVKAALRFPLLKPDRHPRGRNFPQVLKQGNLAPTVTLNDFCCYGHPTVLTHPLSTTVRLVVGTMATPTPPVFIPSARR